MRHIFIGLNGGHVAPQDGDPLPANDIAMTAAGPGSNLVMGGALYLAGVGFESGGFAGVLLWVNLLLGVSNLLPIGGMDGARVVRAVVNSFVPDRLEATRLARLWSSVILAFAAAALAVWLMSTGHQLAWLLAVNAVLFGFRAFASANTDDAVASISTLRAADVMQPGVIVRPGTLLARIIQEHLTRDASKATRPYVVMDGSNVLGVISSATLTAARSSHVDWRTTTVDDAMDPIDRVPIIGPETLATTILDLAMLSESDVALVVDDDGDLIGCVTVELLDLAARERMAA